MSRAKVAVALAALLLVGWQEASGYAHFVRYLTRNGPFQPVLTRFDLRSAPGKRIPFFIERAGPEQLAEGDSREALFSQIRAAANVWNTVRTSELRLTFGGLSEPGTPMSGPRVEVVFDEVPPGLVAMGGPEVLGEVTEKDGSVFVPIVKSLLVLPANLAEPARPSWSERLFQTIVHELGHTIGLQHSWASGTMSTEITRATTKGLPLSADDIAGISALYPTAQFREETGSISGRVLMGGTGVHLASVVALTPTGEAVSALTAPDGSYRILGLAPGSYYVYAHPLPPGLAGEPQPVNLDLPIGPDGAMAPGGAFDLTFFPSGQTPEFQVEVKKGETNDGVWFTVQPRSRVNLHSVQTYRFLGQTAVKPAYLHAGQERGSVVLFGYGMSTMTGPVAGLTASLLRAPEELLAPGVFAYAPAPSYLQTDLRVPEDAAPGIRHMLFRLNGETHVAPGAYRVARNTPPAVEKVETNADGSVTVRGLGFTESARVLFDGAAGRIEQREATALRVSPPPARQGHRARVSVFDGEGQSSAMLDGGTSHAHVYDTAPDFAIQTRDAALPPGVEAVVEITAAGARWESAPGLGFGSSDVTVHRVWRTGAERLLAQVSVAPAAVAGPLAMTVADGLRWDVVDNALQVFPATVRRAYLVMSAMADAPMYPGGLVTLPVGNLTNPLFPATTSVRIGGQAAQVVSTEGTTVTVRVPAGLEPGVAVVRLSVSGEEALPGAIVLTAPPPAPPAITAALSIMGLPLQAGNAPAPGDLIQLRVSGLAADTASASLKVRSGAIEHAVIMLQKMPADHSLYVQLSEQTPRAQSIPLVLTVGDLQSQPFTLQVR